MSAHLGYLELLEKSSHPQVTSKATRLLDLGSWKIFPYLSYPGKKHKVLAFSPRGYMSHMLYFPSICSSKLAPSGKMCGGKKKNIIFPDHRSCPPPYPVPGTDFPPHRTWKKTSVQSNQRQYMEARGNTGQILHLPSKFESWRWWRYIRRNFIWTWNRGYLSDDKSWTNWQIGWLGLGWLSFLKIKSSRYYSPCKLTS